MAWTGMRPVVPDKPFFLHFCPGVTHAPHHVPREWADRYRGQFDDGWDAYREVTFANQKRLGVVPADTVLSRHDPDVPEWESLSPDAHRLAARMMEVFAGFLSHTDHEIGRLLDFLQEIDELDNTLIMVVSDNGANQGPRKGAHRVRTPRGHGAHRARHPRHRTAGQLYIDRHMVAVDRWLSISLRSAALRLTAESAPPMRRTQDR
ncbi:MULTISPECIES: sulfatase-like hydrolase/transferase [unclassified Streptomyces]|uniref:sulfatase-like hydrolase/transferase n=1 Tax=unclassified Streptomyces TaxID=2593676 RepID=UPI003323D27F